MPEFECPICKISHHFDSQSLKRPIPCHGCGHLLSFDANKLIAGDSASGIPNNKSTVLISGKDFPSASNLINSQGTMVIECPGCTGRIRVPKSKGGAKAKCPRCQELFVIPVHPEESVAEAKLLRYDKNPLSNPPQFNTRKIFCPNCGLSSEIPMHAASETVICLGCQNRFVPDAMAHSNLLVPVTRFDFEDLDEAKSVVKRKRRRSTKVIGFCCPYCGTDAPPDIRSEITTAGWITFFVLLSSVCGLLFCWIGFLIREEKRYCSQCGIRIGG